MNRNTMAIRLLLLIMMLLFPLSYAAAQTSVKEMRRRAALLQKQIDEKSTILLSSEKDVKSKLKNINLLTAKINERKELIKILKSEILMLDDTIADISRQVSGYEKDVAEAKEHYAEALRSTRRYGSFRNKLLFIVSAEDFNTMVRRYRYARQYMNAHRSLADELKEKIALLDVKRSALDSVRSLKSISLQEQNKHRDEMLALEKQQRGIVADLQKENRKVKKELEREQKRLDKLNSEINNLIAKEIEKQQKAREKAMARKQEERRPKQSQKEASSASKGKNMRSDAGVGKLSKSFLKSKGLLPVPITGTYHAVNEYGRRKGILGKGNVMLDKKGISFHGTAGAKARCVYDGTVTSTIIRGDYAFVLVSHGDYSTAYIGLESISVKPGDKLKAGTIMGSVARDTDGKPVLLFQLWKGKVAINPSGWIKM
ncbi:MAG: peptidoglycan DD-metalloendopeptidase family protein [Bacteroidaceae bacterium]|nr:peptidoglycan DD-metalloendopeptidase family protein [Bacteroidaceae bacterium]